MDTGVKLRRAKEPDPVEEIGLIIVLPVGSKVRLEGIAKELGFVHGQRASISKLVVDLLIQVLEQSETP